MARKKKKPLKKTRSRSSLRNEISGILTIAFGILIFFGVFFQRSSGVFGAFVSSFLSGMLGWPYRILPFLVIILGLFLVFSKVTDSLKKRIFNTILLILFISCFFHIAYLEKNPEAYDGIRFFKKISAFYTNGQEDLGGGFLGGILAMPVISLFGIAGAYVTFAAFTIINIIIITNKSLKNFFINVRKVFMAVFRWMADSFRPLEQQAPAKGQVRSYEQQRFDIRREKKPIDFRVGEKRLTAPDEEIRMEQTPEPVPRRSQAKKARPADRRDAQEADAIGEEAREHPSASSHLYRFPPISLLEYATDLNAGRENPNEVARKLEETLSSFGVEARVVNYFRGPTVTRYELQPQSGVKVSRITSLADDIALNLASRDVRIEAPVPGKSVVGIEVPNREKSTVTLREIIESNDFNESDSPLTISIGKDIGGKIVVADIKRMPHLLIAGATGSGKSVCLNTLITSLLYKASPDEVKLLLIDPKKVELAQYNGIPHLLIPVINNVKKAAGALNWAVVEMTQRYDKFNAMGAKDIYTYNEKAHNDDKAEKIPHIVIIIDELADLMVAAPGEVEDSIIRLAQLARAAGMHLVIATQRPSVNVITGLIKANIPSRIAFSVVSQVDSRTILDMGGAEKLLGSGDLLYHPIGMSKPVRLQGAFVSDREIARVVEFVKGASQPVYDDEVIEKINSGKEGHDSGDDEVDELLARAVDLVIEAGQASVSYIQRKLKVGYARAARIVDQMEERGIVGPFEGSKPRGIMISKDEWEELQMSDPHSFDYRNQSEKGE
ncbi:MAG: DNA translocase FtsK 4TM domain-containing protein [Clostridia bacterium]